MPENQGCRGRFRAHPVCCGSESGNSRVLLTSLKVEARRLLSGIPLCRRPVQRLFDLPFASTYEPLQGATVSFALRENGSGEAAQPWQE